MEGSKCSLFVDKKSTRKQKLSEQTNIKDERVNMWTTALYREVVFIL